MNPSIRRRRGCGCQGLALGLLLVGGCDQQGLENPDRPDLQPPVVAPERDLLFPYDLRPRVLDFAWLEDLSVPPSVDLADASVPIDIAVPDLANPVDLARPDLRVVDLSMPDQRIPDLSMPDARPPDLVTLPDMSVVPKQFAAPVWVSQNVNTVALTTGDFNGDGKRDIVFCDDKKGELNPLFGNGDGTFKAGTAVVTPCTWNRLDGFDVDKDGRWDLLPGGVLARGNANNTFTVTRLTHDGAVCDTNSDGNIDIQSYVSVPAGQPNVHYFTYQNGDFVADAGPVFAVQAAPNDRTCSGPLAYSKGGVTCFNFGITAYLFAGASLGKPLGVSGGQGVLAQQLLLMRAYDSNLDGQPDGSGLGSRVFGTTSFRECAFCSEDIKLNDGLTMTFGVFDLDGDGSGDIVGTSQADSQIAITYRGFPAVYQTIPFNLPVFGNGVGLADFDGDKKIDIAVAVGDANRKTGGVLLFRGL